MAYVFLCPFNWGLRYIACRRKIIFDNGDSLEQLQLGRNTAIAPEAAHPETLEGSSSEMNSFNRTILRHLMMRPVQLGNKAIATGIWVQLRLA